VRTRTGNLKIDRVEPGAGVRLFDRRAQCATARAVVAQQVGDVLIGTVCDRVAGVSCQQLSAFE
jgi:hypothetical protein